MSYASHWRLVRSTFILIFLIQKERKKFRWLSWRVHTKLLQSQKANSIGFVEKWELPKEHAIFVFILFAKGSLTLFFSLLHVSECVEFRLMRTLPISWVDTWDHAQLSIWDSDFVKKRKKKNYASREWSTSEVKRKFWEFETWICII